MTYADLLPLYYPPVSYDVRATHQAAERRAEAAIFDGVQTQSEQVQAAAYAPTAGVNRAGERLAREDIMWVWQVDVAAQSQTVWHLRAGSGTAGSRLSQYSDGVIESLFNRLKPAHTAIRFTYR